ncbi:MAG: metallophosphoesterase [Candidatus Njordarchaeales archaeon]
MLLKRYNLTPDIILLPNRTLFIRSIKAVVAADLHIGIEYAMALKGVYIPAIQFQEILANIKEALEKFSPEKLIIVGDFKHEFAQKTLQEHKETIRLLEIIKSFDLHFILVRGNHDNFIRGVLERFNVDFREPYYVEKNYLFIHGHKDLPIKDLEKYNPSFVIMGHEHPAVMFRDDIGGKDKIPSFLFGSFPGYERTKLLVLPALSPLATGVEVNASLPSDFLSPILQKANIDEFIPIGVLSSGLLEMPKIRKLREF